MRLGLLQEIRQVFSSQLSTTRSVILPSWQLPIVVGHCQLHTMAPEMKEPIDWLLLSNRLVAVTPESEHLHNSHTQCTNIPFCDATLQSVQINFKIYINIIFQ